MGFESTADMPSPSILVVDPDHFGYRAIEGILASAGYRVLSASDPVAASERIRTSRFDAVLIKLRLFDVAVMSVYSGLTRASNVPLIIVGPQIDGREKGRLFDAGFADYIEFPFDRDELIARLASSIRTSRRAKFWS